MTIGFFVQYRNVDIKVLLCKPLGVSCELCTLTETPVRMLHRFPAASPVRWILHSYHSMCVTMIPLQHLQCGGQLFPPSKTTRPAPNNMSWETLVSSDRSIRCWHRAPTSMSTASSPFVLFSLSPLQLLNLETKVCKK